MQEKSAEAGAQQISAQLYAADEKVQAAGMLDLSGATPKDLAEIGELMSSLANLRQVEQKLLEASKKYMKLSALDMRAVHYLIVAKRETELVTPSMLSKHLGISAASVTKLINRLEAAGHVSRRVHPADRRAFAIEIAAETEKTANETVGKQQARRFYAALRLNSAERNTVISFLNDMAAELTLPEED